MKELLHELQSQVSVLQNLYQPISYSWIMKGDVLLLYRDVDHGSLFNG